MLNPLYVASQPSTPPAPPTPDLTCRCSLCHGHIHRVHHIPRAVLSPGRRIGKTATQNNTVNTPALLEPGHSNTKHSHRPTRCHMVVCVSLCLPHCLLARPLSGLLLAAALQRNHPGCGCHGHSAKTILIQTMCHATSISSPAVPIQHTKPSHLYDSTSVDEVKYTLPSSATSRLLANSMGYPGSSGESSDTRPAASTSFCSSASPGLTNCRMDRPACFFTFFQFAEGAICPGASGMRGLNSTDWA